MKKAYAIIGILFAVITTHYLVAEEREQQKIDFEKVAQELKKAVAEGKISAEDARRRMAALRERVSRDQNRKPTAARGEREHDGNREALVKWGREQRMKIEELKKAGKHEEAEKMGHEIRRVWAEKMRHRETDRAHDHRREGDREQHREGDHHREHSDKGHHGEKRLELWTQERARKIEELAKAGKHEEARELERETKRIVEERMRHMHEQERERHHRERGERGHEEDELRRFAHERERKIKDLLEEGRHEEARRLSEDTRRTIEEKKRHMQDREHHDHEHTDRRHEEDESEERFERWVGEQKRHIHELHERGRREEAEQAERELAEKMEHFHRERERQHGDRERHEGNRQTEQRVHHLMVAIENLRAAGMHDLAEEVERRAHGDHRERGDRDHRGDDHGDERGRENNDLNQLRGEVDDLRRALREMREFIGKRHEERNR